VFLHSVSAEVGGVAEAINIFVLKVHLSSEEGSIVWWLGCSAPSALWVLASGFRVPGSIPVSMSPHIA